MNADTASSFIVDNSSIMTEDADTNGHWLIQPSKSNDEQQRDRENGRCYQIGNVIYNV